MEDCGTHSTCYRIEYLNQKQKKKKCVKSNHSHIVHLPNVQSLKIHDIQKEKGSRFESSYKSLLHCNKMLNCKKKTIPIIFFLKITHFE